jgi:hypothetical protein
MISYEWDIETCAVDDGGEHGDVLDHNHRARLTDFDPDQLAAGIAERVDAAGHISRLVLVRDSGNDVEGLKERQWAYLEKGAFPDAFDNGAMVPARYRRELDRAVGSLPRGAVDLPGDCTL